MRTLSTVLNLSLIAFTLIACDTESAKSDAAAPAGGGELATGVAGLTVIEGKSGIEDGFVVIRGELKNQTNQWISGRVLVDLLDASGAELAVDSIQAGVAADLGNEAQELVVVERDVIPPGESSPFEYLRDVSKLGGTYGKHRLVGDGREVTGVGRAEVFDLASKYELGAFEVTGEAKGTSAEACEDPAAIVVLYDASGKVQEVEGVPLQDASENFLEKLDKDQTNAFRLTIRGDETATLEAFVRCEQPD